MKCSYQPCNNQCVGTIHRFCETHWRQIPKHIKTGITKHNKPLGENKYSRAFVDYEKDACDWLRMVGAQ